MIKQGFNVGWCRAIQAVGQLLELLLEASRGADRQIELLDFVRLLVLFGQSWSCASLTYTWRVSKRGQALLPRHFLDR